MFARLADIFLFGKCFVSLQHISVPLPFRLPTPLRDASYYTISGHTQKHVAGSTRIWYERLKVITLPRHLVMFQADDNSGL